MLTHIRTYYKKAKWLKWISLLGLPIIGIILIAKGYMLIQNNSGHLSGTLYVISGLLWFFGGVIEWITGFLTQIGRFVCTVIETIMVLSGTVLIFIA